MTSIAKGSMRRLALTLLADDCMERNGSPPRQTHHHQWKVQATTWRATYGNMPEESHDRISLPTIQYSRFLRRHAVCRELGMTGLMPGWSRSLQNRLLRPMNHTEAAWCMIRD
jgi:hypothetical protein